MHAKYHGILNLGLHDQSYSLFISEANPLSFDSILEYRFSSVR